MTYLWTNLSDHDFEVLCRDLFQEEFGILLESFARGPDEGIDLRGFHSPDGTLVIQCKHYPRTSFANLLAASKRELPKLEAMAPPPDRVFLATSRSLTPANKARICEALTPFVRGGEDIFGEDDLENLLGRHPQVERRHYKLWLSSGDRLTAIANSAVLSRSQATTERLLNKARVFVHNEKLNQARNLLRHRHTCIISGPPGVGKTTLAGMLTLEYLSDRFQLFQISEDVREAEEVYQPGTRQLFVYDDFLGRTNLQPALGKNEDRRLIDFIRLVGESDSKRFILTTREYIYRAARHRYDLLADAGLDVLRLTIEMTSYSRLERARILYNHLYFADGVTPEDLEPILENRNYLKIIDHAQFNPRLIEYAVDVALSIRESA